MTIPYKIIFQSAFLTVLMLFGGVLAGGLVGNLIFRSLSSHSITNSGELPKILGAIPLAAVVLAGSGAWGKAIGGLANTHNRWRMAVAGILGFVPITILLAFVLLNLADRMGHQLPTHYVFTLLFVPTAFLIAGTSTWAIGRGLRNNALAVSLFWRVGLTAAGTFLIVNLVMEASGWVVGAWGAAARYTMLIVMFTGNLGAALTGGAVLGWILATRRGSK
jgi:hypothetical protein